MVKATIEDVAEEAGVLEPGRPLHVGHDTRTGP